MSRGSSALRARQTSLATVRENASKEFRGSAYKCTKSSKGLRRPSMEETGWSFRLGVVIQFNKFSSQVEPVLMITYDTMIETTCFGSELGMLHLSVTQCSSCYIRWCQ